MGESETIYFKIRILTILILVFVSSCGQLNYKGFKEEAVNHDYQGIIIGRINVIYNNQPYSEHCKIKFDSIYENLTKEGYVFLGIERGPVFIIGLECKDGRRQNQAFQGIGFEVGEGVNYFWDITFYWKNEEPYGFMKAFASSYAGHTINPNVGAAMERAADAQLDGGIKISVADNMQSVLKVYQQHVGHESSSVKKSIASVGYQANQ